MPHHTTIKVRYVECDMQGHVFNAHYLTWFDIAHTAALEDALGGPYAEFTRTGLDLAVSESGVRYLAPAHFNDELQVAVRFEPPTRTSLTSRFTVLRDGEPIATGFLRHVCIDGETVKKRPWPEPVQAALLAKAQE